MPPLRKRPAGNFRKYFFSKGHSNIRGGLTEATAVSQRRAEMQNRATTAKSEEELRKMHGESIVQQAKKELEEEFLDKNAVKIDFKRKIKVQPQIDFEVDPKLRDTQGANIGRDGAGNIYINVGANASGMGGEEKRPQTASTHSEAKAQINLPERPHTGEFGGHHPGAGIDLNTPEHKAADWLHRVRHDASMAAKGYGNMAKTYAEARAENRLATRMNRNLTMPGKHPIQFLRNTRGLVLHPISAAKNSWIANSITNRGLRKQVRLSRQASQRLILLGNQTAEKIDRAMIEYRKMYAENRFKAVPWIEKELYGITSAYTKEQEAIVYGSKRQQGAMAFNPYGIYGRRYDNRRQFLARATKAWRD